MFKNPYDEFKYQTNDHYNKNHDAQSKPYLADFNNHKQKNNWSSDEETEKRVKKSRWSSDDELEHNVNKSKENLSKRKSGLKSEKKSKKSHKKKRDKYKSHKKSNSKDCEKEYVRRDRR